MTALECPGLFLMAKALRVSGHLIQSRNILNHVSYTEGLFSGFIAW